MIIKAFKFEPSLPPFLDSNSKTPVTFWKNYSFIIGKKDRPTAEDRERIEAGIARAWSGIFGSAPGLTIIPPNYGISVIRDSGEARGESEIPALKEAGFYLLFILIESDSQGSEEEEREITEEISRMLSKQFENSKAPPRIGFVVLYNGSVTMLEGIGESVAEVKSYLGRAFPR